MLASREASDGSRCRRADESQRLVVTSLPHLLANVAAAEAHEKHGSEEVVDRKEMRHANPRVEGSVRVEMHRVDGLVNIWRMEKWYTRKR